MKGKILKPLLYFLLFFIGTGMFALSMRLSDRLGNLDLPSLSIQEIPHIYDNARAEDIARHLKQLSGYNGHVNRYIVEICKRHHNEDAEIKRLCDRQCAFADDVPMIVIPPRVAIKDDGSLTDDEIIIRLVDHINYLKTVMREHNDAHQLLINDNKRSCLLDTTMK